MEIITGVERRRRWSVEEKLRRGDLGDGTGQGFLAVTLPGVLSDPALPDGDAGLEIVLPDGLHLRVTARTDLDLVARVLTLLRR